MAPSSASMGPMSNTVRPSNRIHGSQQYYSRLGDCQGDVYPCLQGNNVSCRVACATYGRVTCLTYQNTRACEQYLRMQGACNTRTTWTDKFELYLGDRMTGEKVVTDPSFLSTNPFDALRYSGELATESSLLNHPSLWL